MQDSLNPSYKYICDTKACFGAEQPLDADPCSFYSGEISHAQNFDRELCPIGYSIEIKRVEEE